jgi:hypothetical protein
MKHSADWIAENQIDRQAQKFTIFATLKLTLNET